MLGAIIGDIAGSRFEWDNIKTKDFELFDDRRCEPTDDSVMSLAIAKALMNCAPDFTSLKQEAVSCMQEFGKKYPHAGYGGSFKQWIHSRSPQPYNSWGNGSAMRVSACGYAANSIEQAIALSRTVTEVTHNHPEGMKGAESVAVAIFMALHGSSMLDIQDHINKDYYAIDFKLDDIRATYTFDVSCQGSVPQAFAAFFESKNFEDAIRNAISIGGDSDTIAAITGSLAEAYYGVPSDIRKHALTFLDEYQLKILTDFENTYPPKTEIFTEVSSYDLQRDSGNTVSGSSRSEMIRSAMDAADADDEVATKANAQTTSQQLFSRIYGACSKIRGPIGREEYKTYIIPLLFFKRISDVYDEETENVKKQYGEAAAFFFKEEDIHTFVIPDGCHWQDVRNVSENVGIAIINAMTGIESANGKKLQGVFSSFDDADWANKNKLSDEVLKDLIEHLSAIHVGNGDYSADVMGDSYEYLIKQFAEIAKKTGGEFYTPRAVVKLLVKILDPKAGDTVYDPTCGTGGMLIESIHHMQDQKLSYGKIFGQEVNPSTAAIARMNLFLHGAQEFNIEQGDTLRNPRFTKAGKIKTFDCVIANPPFGLSEWGAAMFANDPYGRNIWGCPTDSNADYAWLQHMVQSMEPNTGKCTVILPQGVLFHGGKEGDMRRQLIESDKLECVIALVGGLFYGAGVSACVLYLNNNKAPSRAGKVCLIDASEIYTPQRAQKIMSDENVEEAYRLFKDFTDVVGRSKVVTIEDLKAHDYTLSVNTYIEKSPVPPMDPIKVRSDYFAALENVKACEETLYALLQKGGYIDG